MFNPDCLSDDSGCIELELLKREAQPKPTMKLGI